MTANSPEERLGQWIGTRFAEVETRLNRIESDLAEIKARLAHASPGYDMRPEPGMDADMLKKYVNLMAGKQEEGR